MVKDGEAVMLLKWEVMSFLAKLLCKLGGRRRSIAFLVAARLAAYGRLAFFADTDTEKSLCAPVSFQTAEAAVRRS
jgi:hypothetical protein